MYIDMAGRIWGIIDMLVPVEFYSNILWCTGKNSRVYCFFPYPKGIDAKPTIGIRNGILEV